MRKKFRNAEEAEEKELEESATHTGEKHLIIAQKKEEAEKVNENSAETEEVTTKSKLPADPAKDIEIEDPDGYLLFGIHFKSNTWLFL